MKKNSIATGLFLIGLAAVLMLSSLGLIPDIPWFKLICSIAIGSWGMKSLLRRDFFGMAMSSSIIAWIFEEELMIEHLAPFPLCIAAAFLGVGLNMIFGKKKQVIFEAHGINEARHEEWTEGRKIVLENNFNSTNRYVNAEPFSYAVLENNFGSANIYFNNAVIYGDEAVVNLENNFGQMNIYFPSKWRARVSQDIAFGHVNVMGQPNSDMDAPCVIIKAESNFGNINIFFE